MQMYYFYGLTSVLASIGGSGQLRVAWRLRIGLRFDRKLKKRFGCHPEQSDGSAFCRIERKIHIPWSVPKLIGWSKLR